MPVLYRLTVIVYRFVLYRSMAVLPIGDLFTMGSEDSIEAVKLLTPKRVAPAHYNTWPPIAQDPAAWADAVRAETKSEPVVLKPGEKISL